MIDASHRADFAAAMFTIIGGDGKEYGPVSTDQVRSWISGGRANLDTQAKKIGNEQWHRLGDFPEFNEAAAAQPPVADAIPAATPAAAPDEPITDVKAHADALFARSGKIDVFGCLDGAFNLWKKNFGPLVGVTLLIYIVTFVAMIVMGFIPFLGTFSSFVLQAVFFGGLYYYYLGKLRDEPRELGDAFAGFSRGFVPLMISGLLIGLILFATIMICAGPTMVAFFKAILAAAPHNTPPQFPELSGLAITGLIIGYLIVFYLSIGWAFTFLLIIDKRVGPWTALELSRRVVSKQWFRVFFAMLLGGILSILGLFGLIIGVVFTMPLAIATIVCTYEALFNPPAQQ